MDVVALAGSWIQKIRGLDIGGSIRLLERVCWMQEVWEMGWWTTDEIDNQPPVAVEESMDDGDAAIL